MTSGQEFLTMNVFYWQLGTNCCHVTYKNGHRFIYLLSINKYCLHIYSVIIHEGHRRTSRVCLSLEVVHLDISVRYMM